MYIVDYTSDDFKEICNKVNTVIIPIGSVEAHGHHLPLGTDIFSPRLFCKEINEKSETESGLLEIPIIKEKAAVYAEF